MKKTGQQWFVVYNQTSAQVCYGTLQAMRAIPPSKGEIHSFDSFTQAKHYASEHLRRVIARMQVQAKAIRNMKKGDVV